MTLKMAERKNSMQKDFLPYKPCSLGCFWSICLLLLIQISVIYCQLEKKPNILLIVADDYGWNDVGYHGSEIHTPHLDKLAAEGVKLENYYVQPICSPTRSQLMSGRYQIHTGLQHGVIRPYQANGLPLEMPTIADKLKEAGYATHIVGKWHLGFYKKEYTPTYRGFDSHYGYFTGAEDYFTHKRCEGIGIGHQVCGIDLHDNIRPVDTESGHYSTHLFSQKVEELAAKHNHSKPLFIYLPFQSVHGPLEVPEEYKKPYDHIKNRNRREYAGMVSAMDEGIGNITEAFKKYGLWDNTLLIFSTDNGGQIYAGGNNYPLRGWKASLWEGGVHGVGFVSGPVVPNKGTISKGLIHVSDWFPTLLHLVGSHGTVDGLDGFNQWETISQGAPSPRKELLHNIDPLTNPVGKSLYPDIFDTRVRAAIRYGPWKLLTGDVGNGSWIPPPDLPAEQNSVLRFTPMSEEFSLSGEDKKNLWLFNIEEDPNEHNDLSSINEEVVKVLLGRLQHYNSTAVTCRYPPPDPNCDPEKHGGFWMPWED